MKLSHLFAGVCVLAFSTSVAAAQSTPQSAPEEIEAIIVTAQKRAQYVQDVPLAITVAAGADLARRNMSGLSDLRNIDPSLNFAPNFNPNQASISLRGVGTSTLTTGIEQSVSVVVDGVVLANPTAVENLGDIERVEILRGPQGMLFGRNASSGVVSITTRLPKLGVLAGEASASMGEREERILNGVLNLPVSDTVALRLAAGYRHLKGAVTDVVTGKDTDPISLWSARGKLLWSPSDDFNAVLSVDYSERDRWCCGATTFRNADPNLPIAPGFASGDSAAYGIVPGPNNTRVALSFLPKGNGKLLNASITLNYDLNGWDFTSVTGYSQSKQSFFIDLDSVSGDYASVGNPLAKYKNWSQEVRVASPVSDHLDFVAGIFYYGSQVKGPIDLRIGQDFINTVGGALGLPPGTLPPGTIRSRNTTKVESAAAFFQANFHLSSHLTIVAGARFSHDEGKLSEFSQAVDPPGGATGLPPPFNFIPYCGTLVTCGVLNPQRVQADNLSWRIGPQYKVSDNLMLYAYVARGYKSPGFSAVSLTPPFGPDQDQRVRSEIPTSYEAGIKADFMNRRVQLAFNIFHTDYKNYQAAIFFDPPGAAPATQAIQNTQLNTQGAELGVSMIPTEHIRLGLNAAYIDARYGDFPGVPCYAGQPGPASCASIGFMNANGNRLVNSPKWTYNLSFAYERPSLINNITGFASLHWNWRGETEFSANGDPSAVQGSYGILSGDIGVGSDDGRWRLALYGRNIFNKRFVTSITAQSAASAFWQGTAAYQTFGTDSFRRIGVKFDVAF